MRNHLVAADWWPVSHWPAADLLGTGSPAELASNPTCLMPRLPAESPSDRSTDQPVLEPVAELYYRCSRRSPELTPKSKQLPPAKNSHLERYRRAADYLEACWLRRA